MLRRVAVVSLFLAAAPAFAQTVVPNDRAAVAGTAGFLGPLSSAQRTYQLLVDESQLTTVLGQPLVGMRWRLLPAATTAFPAADATFASYDVRLSGSVDPSVRSLTFVNNVVGPQTLVRSGPLTIPGGSFPVGSSPQPFGHVIGFDTPYVYTGGDLLIEIRHTGLVGGSASVDAIGTTTPGYGTAVSAAWTGNAAGTSGSQGNAVITELVVPEPGAVSLAVVGIGMLARRSRSRIGSAA
jgi:hypothetical protein